MRLPESRKGKRIGLAVAIAAAVGVYYAISRLIPHDDLQQMLEDVSNTLGAWTYLLVGAFAFLETGAFVGLVVPGETVMLLGGAVAGQGAIDIYLLIAIAWFSAWAGDTTSFFVGRRLGRGFVLEHGPRVGISHERFHRVEAYFGRHGGKTILIGRFISLVRALAPFVAGSSGMRYRAFVPYSILGTGMWASAHILIGYFFSRSIDTAAKYAGRGAFLLALLIVLVVGVVLAVRFLREAENRRRAVRWMEQRSTTSWLVAVGRRLKRPASFVWARLTPGRSLGLQFTTLMAMLAVGLFVLISYTATINDDPGPTRGDTTAEDVVDSLRTDWLTDVSKAVSVVGSAGVTWPLALVCAAALAMRRRWPELAVLLTGMLLTILVVHDLKAATDRPRPPNPLVDSEGSSFPSGHAAYSMLYVWLAVTVAVRLRSKVFRGTPLVLAGIAIAALIGLSRVYLGVHYMSDVYAGWALGGSAFAFCGLVALIIIAVRENSATMGARSET
jgi:membrane protein DedA with SNARE-associated domain